MLAVTSGSLLVNAYFLRNSHRKIEMLYKSMIEQKLINDDNKKEHKTFKRRISRIHAKQVRTELALDKRY